MSWLIISAAGGVGLFVAVVALIWVFRKNHFRYEALVIAQVGDGLYWMFDKFGVKKNEKGFFELSFKHQRDVETSSPVYNQWVRMVTDEKATKAMLSGAEANKHGYTQQDINRFINRGCVFLKTGEGNVVPIDFRLSEGDETRIRLLTFDNNQKSFIKEKYKQEAEMGGSNWSKYAPALLLGGTIIVCAGMFLVSFVYLSNSLTEGITEVARGVAAQAGNWSGVSGVGG